MPLCRVRGAAPAAEQPDHDTGCGDLDQAVEPEADERDRAGRDPGGQRDRSLAADAHAAVERGAVGKVLITVGADKASVEPG